MNALCGIILFFVFISSPVSGKIKVVTTITDIADFARQVGGDKVEVDHIVSGDQNPHFVDVKPSYMIKLKSADVFLMIGMELELWAQQVIDGSRNQRLDVVDLSRNISKLEIPDKIDASQGDVHRFGNPHYWLDPRNIRIIVGDIAAALTRASPVDEAVFQANARAYVAAIDSAIARWEDRMKPFAGSKVVTFHKSWPYLAQWIGIVVIDQVEPKPGIQPSPSHTAALIQRIREVGVKAILVEPFYDVSAPELIAEATNAKVVRLATSVGGVNGANDYISTMNYNLTTLTNALR
jgi:ABC-type Zn uptake system ZnuABC Zn-binding protein ZnuA